MCLFAGSQRREATAAAINIDRATEAAGLRAPPVGGVAGVGVGGSFGLGLEKSVFFFCFFFNQARKRI